jgi:hypothetical protein
MSGPYITGSNQDILLKCGYLRKTLSTSIAMSVRWIEKINIRMANMRLGVLLKPFLYRRNIKKAPCSIPESMSVDSKIGK